MAYWRPKQPLAAGKEATFAYRQFWCWSPPARPPFAVAVLERSAAARRRRKLRRFIVQFAGDNLGDPQRVANLRPDLDDIAGIGDEHLASISIRRPKTCRVVFDVDPDRRAFCELRLVLQSGDEPISETWLYRWTSVALLSRRTRSAGRRRPRRRPADPAAAPPMPPERRLEMPTQSLWQFKGRGASPAPAAPQLWAHALDLALRHLRRRPSRSPPMAATSVSRSSTSAASRH